MQHAQFAECPIGNQLCRGPGRFEQAKPRRATRHHAIAARRDHFTHLTGIHGDGLFEEDVFALAQGEDCDIRPARGWQGEHDGFDLRIGDELSCAGVRFRHLETARRIYRHLLAHILGRGSNSRLYQTLVVDKGIAVSAGANYDGTTVDATRFTLYATPKPGTSLPQLEAAIDAVLAEAIENGVTAEELERAKSRMIADAVYANDNQRTMAKWYGSALATGATVEQVRTWPDRIRALTADAVREAARRWLDKRRSVTGYLIKDTRPEEKRS